MKGLFEKLKLIWIPSSGRDILLFQYSSPLDMLNLVCSDTELPSYQKNYDISSSACFPSFPLNHQISQLDLLAKQNKNMYE